MNIEPTLRRAAHLRRLVFATTFLVVLAATAWARGAQPQAQEARYDATEVMVPMRDGVKLHTVICVPKNQSEALPILMQRTPYGASPQVAPVLHLMMKELSDDGYIFVFQDIRGKNGSEG